MQCKFFGYLTLIDDFDEQIERFWDKNEKKIASWYLAQKRPDDLIISASPKCIIGPIAKRLGVNYVATDFDREFGVFLDNMMYPRHCLQTGIRPSPGLHPRTRHILPHNPHRRVCNLRTNCFYKKKKKAAFL